MHIQTYRSFVGPLLALVLSLVPAVAHAQSQLVTTQLRSASFAGSKIGISPDRKVSVYLPADYANGSRRFPVIYYLGYFFEDHTAPFANNDAKALFDKAIEEELVDDVIVVAADFSTPVGSSWYVNSPATGNWEDFMVRELVPHIDANYRTLATRESRGLLGDGAGGFGAIRFAMLHPTLFGSVYAMQPFGTGPSIQPTHSRPDFDLLARAKSMDDLEGFSRIFTSIYQAFLPNAERAPLYFDPPARRVNGRTVVDAPVMARFHERFELMALLHSYADNLKLLRGFKFDWGRQDPNADHIEGAQIFSNRLVEFGVPHEAEEHSGGFRDRHWGVDGRVHTDVLPFFAKHLAFATPIVTSSAAIAQPRAAVSATTEARVSAAQQKLRAAILSNDVDARVRLYRPDARSMPEYQPALYTTDQIAAYHRAMRERLTMTRFDPVTSELFDFGHAVLEFGTFTAGWTAGANAEERRGKYANLWAVEPDGSLRLKADVWGYFENFPDEEVFFVPMAEAASPLLPAPADPELLETVSRLDQADARAVRTRDLEAKLALLADDAIIMPFADTPKRGMAEIRPYLAAYTAAGEGIVFDDVRVWNAGVEQFGEYVVTFSKFHVDWRFPGNKGITKGGGLHLSRRQPDGTLKRIRQIGTHDHVE